MHSDGLKLEHRARLSESPSDSRLKPLTTLMQKHQVSENELVMSSGDYHSPLDLVQGTFKLTLGGDTPLPTSATGRKFCRWALDPSTGRSVSLKAVLVRDSTSRG